MDSSTVSAAFSREVDAIVDALRAAATRVNALRTDEFAEVDGRLRSVVRALFTEAGALKSLDFMQQDVYQPETNE
ncbi:hypothetical protein AB0F15_00295 [Amycolatopsis sp. NPDC026612]|uniref:hypothetical protein n=1 Tax=Amycolatopsis sp. NPDC026612 TaxID=3155466 RepID=UPI0033D46678